MYVSPLTPQQELARLPAQLAYVENLTVAKAPRLFFDGDPEGPDETIDFVFVTEESLNRVKEVLLAEMRWCARRLEEDLAAGRPTPFYS